MLNSTLGGFYERDLRKLIEEINLFKDEENLWKTFGSIKNPAGNLALHIIGGSNYLFMDGHVKWFRAPTPNYADAAQTTPTVSTTGVVYSQSQYPSASGWFLEAGQ